jgi:DNA ligase (NAD+)
MSLVEEAKSLNELLENARDAYYVKHAPIMTDQEFDRKERELKELVAKNPDLKQYAPSLTKVGSDLSNGGRIKHATPMKSIENHYTEEDYAGWYDVQALDGNGLMVEEPKYDGISVSLIYESGMLVRALTRGDGESGEEITKQVWATGNIPTAVSAANFPTGSVEIRGELVMKNSTLKKINEKLAAAGQKTYSSIRNLCAGTMKQKDLTNIPERDIEIRPWDVLGSGLPDSRLERLRMIAKDGFPAPLGVIVTDRASLLKALNAQLEKNKTSDVAADGVVLKIDSVKASETLGVGSNYANFQICFKPQSSASTTYLRNVVWQIGRTGKLTPVGECDPVVLAGAEVRRAALCNITYIREKKLTLNAKIEMLRSGEVIPQIVRVVEAGDREIEIPTHCPECHKKLEVLDEDRTGVETSWCTNAECPGRVRELFAFIGDRDILEVDGLGPEMATRLSAGYARTVGELFTFANEASLGLQKLGEDVFVKSMRKKGFSVTIVNMLASLEKAKTASWDRWIACLGISLVSKSLGKIIAKEMKLTSDSMKDLPALLATFTKLNIDGMGSRKKELITDWLAIPSNVAMCGELYAAGVRPKPLASATVSAAGTPLAGIAFCVTGETDIIDRDKLSAMLESLGATKKSGVSKKCTHLIRLDGPGKNKVADAEKFGIPIVDWAWVVTQLAKGGIKLDTNRFPVED